jgi:hypothetical protein
MRLRRNPGDRMESRAVTGESNGSEGQKIMEPGMDYSKRIGIIGIELLTKAALCAATVGAIAGMAAALFFRS